MSIEKLRPSFTFTEDRLRELQQVVPEAFADGKINWDTLREALGEHLEDEEQEHFGLTWPGKREARQLAAMPSRGTLVPVPGEGINEDTTHNFFIEGDNLEVLKLMQKSYVGKIKMIYIDPPYNTGNDLLYNDNFVDNFDAYLKYIGSKNENGDLLTTNTKADGRFHSKWLNMIYPRLLLARQLLQNDGVIFISIGEEEIHNLKLLMSEVFGDENYISTVARVAKTASNKGTHFAPSIDFILVYAKNIFTLPAFKDEVDITLYKKEDAKGRYRDDVALYQSALDPMRGCINQRYFIECPDGSYVIPPGNVFPSEKKDAAFVKPKTADDKVWRWSYQTYMEKKDLLVFKPTKTSPLINQEGKKASYNIYTKSYLNERQELGTLPRNFLNDFINRKGADYLKTIGIQFDYSKPVQLIQWLISIVGLKDNDIVLDFFVGSGTTADAVIRENINQNSNINWIVIQLPEKIVGGPFSNIAELGKERIRRVIHQIQHERKGLFTRIDFRVLNLTHSHFKDWQPFTENKTTKLESLFDQFEKPLLENWQPLTLITEILLLQGFPLDASINNLPSFHENNIQEVTHEFCSHRLYICLDEKIADKTIDTLSIRSEDIFVCLDTALTDEVKLRLSDRCQLKVI